MRNLIAIVASPMDSYPTLPISNNVALVIGLILNVNTVFFVLLTCAICILYIKNIIFDVLIKKRKLKAHKKILFIWLVSFLIFYVMWILNFVQIFNTYFPPQNIILFTIFLINTGILLLLTSVICILYAKDIIFNVIIQKKKLKTHKILLVWLVSFLIFLITLILMIMFPSL